MLSQCSFAVTGYLRPASEIRKSSRLFGDGHAAYDRVRRASLSCHGDSVMRYRILFTLLSLLTAATLAMAQGEPAKNAKPFDDKADASAALKTALQRAKKDNRRVLILWGDNANEECVLLNKSFTTDAGLRRKKLYEYDLVTIA